MEWIAFAGSVLGGLIAGFFTFIGVKATLQHEKEKEKKEELRKAEESKPRLEVLRYSDFKETANNSAENYDCNVLALSILRFEEDDHGRARFYYDNKALDKKNLVFVEYELKNTGLTEIDDVCVTSNLPKNVSVFGCESRDLYINENLLNYGRFFLLLRYSKIST